jgi:hypothetical protein
VAGLPRAAAGDAQAKPHHRHFFETSGKLRRRPRDDRFAPRPQRVGGQLLPIRGSGQELIGSNMFRLHKNQNDRR